MIIHKEGDKSKAICERCKEIVPVTFRYAPFMAQGLKVPEVMQGFCDKCGDSVSLPHQSTYRIREYRESHNRPVEFRVPPHFTDILLTIGNMHKVSQKPNLLCRLLSELYLSKISLPGGSRIQKQIVLALTEDIAGGKSKDRLSCVFPDNAYATLKTVSSAEHKTTSDIVRGIIVTAKHDILDKRNRSISKEFEELAAAKL
ncbi:MAG: hypothetical protein JNL74_00255 [Fibrobacteres bacterium]|nr:hypothetical protein [Fibrobacterota bacterium]